MATKQVKADPFEAKFQATLDRKVLRKPAPPFVQGNRSHREPVLPEEELQAQTRRFFDGLEPQLAFYSEHLGHDVMWLNDWLKKWWTAWMGGIDHALVKELVAEDCVYKDPMSFGRPLVGLQEFVDYNQAVFDGVPDLRYDPIPGQVAVQVAPDGRVLLFARYIGCGHWDQPIRTYPFTKGSPEIPGTGAFVRIPGVDRYHFNADHQVCEGETLWDGFEALQLLGVMPSDTSLVFKGMFAAGNVAALATRLTRRLPLIGGE